MAEEKIFFDEEELSINILKNGFKQHFNWGEALLVAKHCFFILGYGEIKTRKFLIKFCEDHDPFFNYVRNRKIMKKIIKKARKEGFRFTGDVTIYDEELDDISKIKNFRQQKIALATVALSKRDTNKGYINLRDWRIIRKIVSRKVSNAEIQSTFSAMYSMGMINPVGASQKILFLRDSGESRIHLGSDDDAHKLISTFKDLRGGEIGFCRCGKEFKKSSPRQILCQECSDKSRLEKYKRYNRKRKFLGLNDGRV